MQKKGDHPEKIIASSLELAKQKQSFQSLTARGIAKSAGSSTQSLYDHFGNLEQVKQTVIAHFLLEAVQETSFLVYNVQEALPNSWRAFCNYFFECFHPYSHKKLLLEDPDCRELFYKIYVVPYCDHILKDSNEHIQQLHYTFLVHQVLVDEWDSC